MARYNGNGRAPMKKTVEKDFYNPYAFVPLADRVCCLSESEERLLEQAHDVPFENAKSGKVSITFKAETPFCVKSNGKENISHNGEFFVPATSLKGMIRSVFEIITLSNVKNNVVNSRYSIRDLNSSDYTLKTGGQKSGFLVQIGHSFYVQECYSEQWTYSDIEGEENIRGLKDCKTIEEKYRKISSMVTEWDDESKSMWFFSGHMSNKEHEYLFDIPDFQKLIPLCESEYEDFIFIHEQENENKSWTFWKKRLKNYSCVEEIEKDNYAGVVPCFFRTKKNEFNELVVRDLGFSYLYRQPYEKSIHDFIPSVFHEAKHLDMTQALFGYVDKDKALRGRLHFCHSFIDNAVCESDRTFILGSPKPTFYPFYLEQKSVNKLDTYFSQNSSIAGRKRYILRREEDKGRPDMRESKTTTTFRPLKAGTLFTSEIMFHNLHDHELGALLAAITFCNNQSNCFHSLGYAKPLGYGKMRINQLSVEVDGKLLTESELNDLYTAFVNYLTSACGITKSAWEAMIQPLLTIAGRDDWGKKIRYPELKEFSAIKSAKYKLSDFSPLK